MKLRTFTILQMFCGSGGKGLGAKRARSVFGDHSATFETVGGIDVDPQACADFEMLVGAPTLCVDVHELEPERLRKFAGSRAPDAVMMSPPCKGFSGLLSAKRAQEEHYQRMNQLMLRSLFLMSATWPTPPSLIFVENVPRIASRGKDIVRQAKALLEAHGYAVTIGTHDCGELGGLAQHRRRWFLLARHREQLPQFVYEPPKKRVRACGEVIGPMPLPGDVEAGGPMHSVPRLSWRNWLRLALIPAGGDWRDLPGTLIDGEKRREKFRRSPVTAFDQAAETVTGPGGSAGTANVADPRFGNVERIADWGEPVGTITRSPAPSSGGGAVANPRAQGWFPSAYRVVDWGRPSPTATGGGHPSTGAVVVADPRVQCEPRSGAYGVQDWTEAADTVTASLGIDNGRAAIADPRVGIAHSDGRHWNKYSVTGWDEAAATVTGTDTRVGSGAPSVADPRWGGGRFGVTRWDEAAGTVAGESLPNNGKYSVADPRFADGKKKNWQQVAGVTPWTSPFPVVTSSAKIHAGAYQVADPRIPNGRVMSLAEALALDLPPNRWPGFVPIIIAADGTWHRPITTLELAALQSLPTVWNGSPLVLAGTSHTRWREAIGNLVPPDAAQAIAEQLLHALLIGALGAFALESTPIWVAPHRAAVVA